MPTNTSSRNMKREQKNRAGVSNPGMNLDKGIEFHIELIDNPKIQRTKAIRNALGVVANQFRLTKIL